MQALVLAGGSGTRFWPVSRRHRPKQLLALEGGRSLLQRTVDRLQPLAEPGSVWVCTTRSLAEQVREQLPEVPHRQVLAEPVGRNTAAAIGWSAQTIRDAVGDEVIAVLPSDHRVGRPEPFRATLAAAVAAAAAGRILALGVQPRWAETGYGYLELGPSLDDATGLRRVRRFTEKPDADTARMFFDSGDYLWNAGIFVFRAADLLERLARCEPRVGAGLAEIRTAPERLDEIYAGLPSVSIDHGVMERLDDLVTLPLDCDWSDLGSWEALAEILPADPTGNAVRGEVLVADGERNLLISEDGLIAALGVSELVVVRTADAVLVLPRDRAQEVRRLVEELRTRRPDLL